MKGKWLWIFVGAAILQIIVNGLAIWEKFKMIDKNIILQVGLAIILVGSGIMYLVEKYKELRNKLQSVLLFIDSAKYGVVGKTNDVTDVLRSKVVLGRIENFSVTNSTLGPDPAKGDTNKKLTVKYIYCGKLQIIEIPEKGILSIP
jgi:hypothetical protein